MDNVTNLFLLNFDIKLLLITHSHLCIDTIKRKALRSNRLCQIILQYCIRKMNGIRFGVSVFPYNIKAFVRFILYREQHIKAACCVLFINKSARRLNTVFVYKAVRVFVIVAIVLHKLIRRIDTEREVISLSGSYIIICFKRIRIYVRKFRDWRNRHCRCFILLYKCRRISKKLRFLRFGIASARCRKGFSHIIDLIISDIRIPKRPRKLHCIFRIITDISVINRRASCFAYFGTRLAI